MYGTQTVLVVGNLYRQFENDVKMYGTQTNEMSRLCSCMFENDVKMYGTQTRELLPPQQGGLRMM